MNKQKLMEIVTSTTNQSAVQQFRKDCNTMPRLLNFLFQHPDKVATSKLLSGRHAIQTRQTNENNELYVAAVEKFNDCTLSSGGLVSDHQVLLTKRINPDAINPGVMTVLYAHDAFKDLIVKYSEMSHNMERSGTHESEPWEYCKGNTDLLYIHLWLQKLDNPHLQQFCTEGNETPFSFDSGISIPTPSPEKKRRRREEIDILSMLKDNMNERKIKENEYQKENEAAIAASTAARLASLAQIRLYNFDLITKSEERIRKMEADGLSDTQEYHFFAGIKKKAMDDFV
jgi:hypothetical protein